MDENQRLLVKQSIAALRPHTQRMSDLFYQQLFVRMPELERLFRPDAGARLTKFTSMLATFDNLKYLDKIAPALVALGRRHQTYGVRPEHYAVGEEAFMVSLRAVRASELTRDEWKAWQALFQGLIPLMTEGGGRRTLDSYAQMDAGMGDNRATHDDHLLEAVGGVEVVQRVHERFYATIFDDEWLGRFFYGKSQVALVKKQTDFMVACFGGDNLYRGESPAISHMHMLIDDEQLDLREKMLRAAILAEGIAPELADRWLVVDAAFRGAIVKQSVDECVMRCPGQMPIVAPKPAGYRWVDKETV